jgi:cell shape-determining protein MreC
MDYVPQEFYDQTTEFLANYQRTREILEEICEINRELLQRREAL